MNSRNEQNVPPERVETILHILPVMDVMLLVKVTVQRPKKSIGKITVSPMNWFLGRYNIFALQDLMIIKKAIKTLNDFCNYFFVCKKCAYHDIIVQNLYK